MPGKAWTEGRERILLPRPPPPPPRRPASWVARRREGSLARLRRRGVVVVVAVLRKGEGEGGEGIKAVRKTLRAWRCALFLAEFLAEYRHHDKKLGVVCMVEHNVACCTNCCKLVVVVFVGVGGCLFCLFPPGEGGGGGGASWLDVIHTIIRTLFCHELSEVYFSITPILLCSKLS